MPVGKAKTSLISAVKSAAAAATEAKQDFSGLPGGITGGVCRLKSWKMGKYASGDRQGGRFVSLVGVVKKPKTALRTVKVWEPDPTGKNKKGVVKTLSSITEDIEGKQTRVQYDLCRSKDRKGEVISESENLATFINDLKLFVGDVPVREFVEGLDDDLDGDKLYAEIGKFLDEVCEADVHVSFGTWSGEPNEEYRDNSKVKETWYKRVEFSDNGQPEAAVEDETGGKEEPEASDEEEGEGTTDQDAASQQAEDVDLDALAEAAGGTDDEEAAEAAGDQLMAISLKAGLTEKEVKEAKNWTHVVKMIRANQTAEEQHGEDAQTEAEEGVEEEAVEEKVVPKKGDSFMCRLWDKDGKRFKKPSQVEVLTVDKKAETVTLKNEDTDKTVLGKDKKPRAVPWDQLEPMPE